MPCQENCCCRRLENRENRMWKRRQKVVRCGSFSKRCFPTNVKSGWPTCPSNVVSNPERLCASAHGNLVIYKRFTICDAALWSEYYAMTINCVGGSVNKDIEYALKGSLSHQTQSHGSPSFRVKLMGIH